MSNEKEYTIITGATGAIGTEIAKTLCLRGEDIILACRNIDKAQNLKEDLMHLNPEIDVRILKLDLCSADSARKAAKSITALPIIGLINNAGVMNRKYTVTDGIETTLAVNFYNTSLFTRQIIDLMGERGGRIVFTTSLTRFLVRKGKKVVNISEKDYSQLGAYAISKRLITDFAKDLCKTVSPNIKVNCADPGVVDTGMITMGRWFDPLADLFFRPFIRSPKKGAIPSIRALDADTSGNIYCLKAIHKL